MTAALEVVSHSEWSEPSAEHAARVRRLKPIEARMAVIRERCDAEGRGAYPQERGELERLRVERKRILNEGFDDGLPDPSEPDSAVAVGDEDDGDRPTVAELRADLDFDAEWDRAAVRPKVRASELRAQLAVAVAQDRLPTPGERNLATIRQAVQRDRRWATGVCLHESAHACVGELSGARVTSLRFDYANGSLVGGSTVFAKGPTPAALVAPLAVAEITGRYNGRAAKLSDDDLALLAKQGVRTVEDRARWLEVSKGYCRRNWGAIQKVATMLLERGTVSGDEVRRTIQGETP